MYTFVTFVTKKNWGYNNAALTYTWQNRDMACYNYICEVNIRHKPYPTAI